MKIKKINNTNVITENIKDTPRCAVYLYFATNKPLIKSGVDVILGNLLLQGTDKKTADEIAEELENLGIEICIDSKIDYLKVSIVCLNEDLESALNITSDFMTNANFKTFEKEIFKFKGETKALLDHPARKAADAFYRELFSGTKYEDTNSKILDSIDELKVEDIKEYYKNLLGGKKVISIAADMENEDEFANFVSSKLEFMKESMDESIKRNLIKEYKPTVKKIKKNDAKQAQIYQGWIVDSFDTEDYPKLLVLNTILGGSGLSSRLFSELRDKKGLAYTVRSSYRTLKDSAVFLLYIGSEPSNIKKSLEGFKYEIERIIKEPPTDEELQGAIENYEGRFKYFYTQTNAQIADSNGWNNIFNLDSNYNEKLLNNVKKVKVEDVVNVCKKYLLNEPVTVVLAPEKFLDF